MKRKGDESEARTFLTEIKRIASVKVSRSFYDTFYLSISNAAVAICVFHLIFLSSGTQSTDFKGVMERAKRHIAKFKFFFSSFVHGRAFDK